MLATVNLFTDPFHPYNGRVQHAVKTRKLTINGAVKKYGVDLSKPVICYHNGELILRKDWQTKIKESDVVSFVYLPQGGGGSNPLRIVLMIAVAVYAPQLAATLGQGMGIAAGSMGMSLLSAGISFLGNALVNALIPPPQPPKSHTANSLSSPSPTYSLGAQGNSARIGQPIPVLYGRMKIYPDFAAQPYAEYEGNDQYLYQLFCITQGRASIAEEDIYIEENRLSSFTDIYTYEVVQPGSSSTLYPTAVYNSESVSGQELLKNVQVGPFIANPPSTTIKAIAIDIVFPKGIYYVDDKGRFATRSSRFRAYATKIDDADQIVGSEFVLGEYTVSGNTSTAIRRTYRFDVAPGRYQVRVSRLDDKSSDSRVAHDTTWAGLRGYSSQNINYGNVTLLALKIKATNTISSQSSRKVNVIAQRLLSVPTYNAGNNTYTFGAEQATNSIAWAVADMCRAEYGAGVAESRYSLAQLTALNAIWASRGEELNCVFDSSQTFWEALTIAVRAGRARPFIQGGLINFVRDSLSALPTALFTNRNIVKNSFKITYIMPSDDTADCVDVEYFDRQIWKPRVVRAALDENSTSKPVKVKAFGVTDRDHAWRDGMKAAADNRYRRKEISFETELEGHIPALGDLIAIQSDIPEWGQYAEVQDVSGAIIYASQPFEWDEERLHYALFRRADGSCFGPVTVSRYGADNALKITAQTLDFDLSYDLTKERTHICFGPAGAVVQLAKTLTIVPREKTVQITAINEDPRVHAADGGDVPTDIYSWAIPAPTTRPVLTDFTLTQSGSGITPSISVSWKQIAGASKYIIERSTDNENWETLGEISGSNFNFVSNIGLIYVRVAAFGGVVGPFVAKSINVGEIAPPANVTSGEIVANGKAFDILFSAVQDSDGYIVEVYHDSSLKRTSVIQSTNYTYTLENAITDGGPWRNIIVKVYAKKGLVRSAVGLSLVGSNAAPAAPMIVLNAGNKAVSITVSPSTESDYAGTVIHASQVPDFEPSAETLIAEGTSTFLMYQTEAQLYYVAAHYDVFGKEDLNYSPVATAIPASGYGVSIQYAQSASGPWNSLYSDGDLFYRTRVDNGDFSEAIALPSVIGSGVDTTRSAFTYTSAPFVDAFPTTITTAGFESFPANGSWASDSSWVSSRPTPIAGKTVYRIDGYYSGAADSTIWGRPYLTELKVEKLSALTADMGDLSSGTITLDLTGHIKGGQTDYATGAGYWLGYGAGAYKFSVGDNDNYIRYSGDRINIKAPNFTLSDTDLTFVGDGIFKGELQAASGTFGGSLMAGVLDLTSFSGETHSYTSAGTYLLTVPAGKTTMRVTVCGGGGGGGGGSYRGYDCGGGGGGGGGGSNTIVTTFNNVTPGTQLTIVVGAGGAGGITNKTSSTTRVGPDGGQGGNSSVVGYITAIGAAGGQGGRTTRTGSNASTYKVTGGAGGTGANGAADGLKGQDGYNVEANQAYINGYVTSYTAVGGKGGAGGIGHRVGGAGGEGNNNRYNASGTSFIGNYPLDGANGATGYVTVEFFNPNSVVLRTDYNILLAALQRQNIEVV